MIEGKAIIKGKRSIYIEELNQTLTEDDMRQDSHMLLGFMNEKELTKVANVYPEYVDTINHILLNIDILSIAKARGF